MSLEIQWLTIAVMLGAGAGMGVLFDSYRVISDYYKFPRWSLSILDMLYWLASAIIVFRLLYLSNFGEVRGYVFIGLAIGVVTYGLFISQIYSKLVMKLIGIVQSVIHTIIKVFDYILVKPLKVLYKFVIFCIKIGTKITIRTIEIVLQLLIPILKVLLWPIKPIYKPVLKYLGVLWINRLRPLLKKWTWLVSCNQFLIKWFNLAKKWIYS